jgi:hypothetical protein
VSAAGNEALGAGRAGPSEDAPEQEYGGRDSTSPSQAVAGYLAAAAIFAGLAALVYYPARIGPGAIVVALVAAGIGGSIKRLTALGVIVAACGFLFGMIIAVVLERPII